MTEPANDLSNERPEPVRVLGRGLRAARGVRMTLRAIREAVGKTQVAVADEAQINQADISRLENRTDFAECQVSTLERYIAALGGELELVAKFGDKRIALAGLREPENTAPANKPLKTDKEP